MSNATIHAEGNITADKTMCGRKLTDSFWMGPDNFDAVTCKTCKAKIRAGYEPDPGEPPAPAPVLTCGNVHTASNTRCDEPAGPEHYTTRDGTIMHSGVTTAPITGQTYRQHWADKVPDVPTWPRLQQLAAGSRGNTLRQLDILTEIIEQAELLRAVTVDQARREESSWTTIGQQIRMSKQAAQQRYGRTIRPRTDPAQLTIDV